MAKSRASFERRERERNKKAKAAAKREERLTRKTSDDDPDALDASGSASASGSTEGHAAVMDELAILHQQYDDKAISFEDFEERKADLLARLQVD